MTILFLTFEITAILMSMCNILQSITSNLLKLGWNFFSFFFMFYIMTVILTGVKQNLKIVLTCIFLMGKNVENFQFFIVLCFFLRTVYCVYLDILCLKCLLRMLHQSTCIQAFLCVETLEFFIHPRYESFVREPCLLQPFCCIFFALLLDSVNTEPKLVKYLLRRIWYIIKILPTSFHNLFLFHAKQ